MPKIKIHFMTIIIAVAVLGLTYGAGILVKNDVSIAPVFFGIIYLVSFIYFVFTIYNLKKGVRA